MENIQILAKPPINLFCLSNYSQQLVAVSAKIYRNNIVSTQIYDYSSIQ